MERRIGRQEDCGRQVVEAIDKFAGALAELPIPGAKATEKFIRAMRESDVPALKERVA